jgi:hypothetical protein
MPKIKASVATVLPHSCNEVKLEVVVAETVYAFQVLRNEKN